MKTNQNLCVTFLVIAFASNVICIYPDGMIHPSLMSWFQNQRSPGWTNVAKPQNPTTGPIPQQYPIENLIQLLSQGQRQSVHQGPLQGGQRFGFGQGQGLGFRQGQGLGFNQGQGQLLPQGQSLGLRQGQGLGRNQGQGQGLGLNQGQGQMGGQGQGVGRSQGKGTGISQRKSTGLSQGKGSSLRPGTRRGTGRSRSRSRSSTSSRKNSMFSRYMMMRRAMRPRRFYVGQVVRPFGIFPGGTVISADGSDATVIDRYGMEHSFDSGRLTG